MPMLLKRAVHPGEVLRDELDEASVLPTAFAAQIELSIQVVEDIIQGRRSVDADAALRLGHWFGTNPQFWLNLQNQFDLVAADQAAGDRISRLATRAA